MSSPKGLSVSARPNEPGDQLVRRFMKRVRDAGVDEEFRRRMFHEPAAARRRRKRARAARLRGHDAAQG